MTMKPLDESETALVQQVMNACQQAIKTAVAQPSQAIGLARGLDAALTSLRLVQTEIGKGESGARAVIENADAISRAALKDVLKHASDPAAAQRVLSMMSAIAPSATLVAPTEPPLASRAGEASASRFPNFSKVSQDYIDMRIERDGENYPDISTLQLRRQTFIDVMDDRPIDQYRPRDLQRYVNKMQFWPANVTKRSDMGDKTTTQILEANQNLALKTMALNTMENGYVANVRTMARHGMADYGYSDPFSGVKLSWPPMLRRPQPREAISVEVTNRVFRNGVESGQLDEAMLPPLAKLTSRRLGLLAFLRGSDIRNKDGVWVAQTSGIVFDQENNRWLRVPIKTGESMTFFVLNNFLDEIGFIDWARQTDGWIFAAPHEHPDPSKYVSKVMGRLLRRSGAKAGEVFHSLRGEGIDEMRRAEVDPRVRRLQAGHELADVHEKYGFRALSSAECKRLADLPLPEGIDWSVFEGLDFDAMAQRRRGRGRLAKGGC